MKINIAILTVSTSGYEGKRKDESGDEIEKICKKNGFNIIARRIVPDKKRVIAKTLKFFSDKLSADIILTTGGTGFSPYDVTPEATLSVIKKIVPGIPEFIRFSGGKKTEKAYLSRGIAGIRKKTLIINLPGSPKGVKESLKPIINILSHSVDMMAGKGHNEK